MEKKLRELLELDLPTPEWCGLLEEIVGQIDNYGSKMGDYSVAEKYLPDIKKFSFDDFVSTKYIEEIPEDWLKFVYKCMEHIGM